MNTIDVIDIKRLLKARGICVVIPTYNNASTIRNVVEGVARYCEDIIVVDDGSTDATSSILAGIDYITLVSYRRNRGKGYALAQGFSRALELGFSYAITLDADGQHYAKDIPAFLRANMKHPGALILGERRLDGVVRSRSSRFANRFSNFWFWTQTGYHLADTQTGYRLYPLKKLRFLRLLTARYEAELELLTFAAWNGVKLVSIPVDVYYPPANERVSHFRPYADFARITCLNFALCLLAVVYGLPLRLWRWLMTFLRTAYSLIVFVFFSLLVFFPYVRLYVFLHGLSEKTSAHLHSLIHNVAQQVVLKHGIPGTKFRYSIAPEADVGKPYVVICNHQSHFDTMCMQALLPKLVFLTNEWVWCNPFYGLLIRSAEYLRAAEGIDTLLPRMRDLVKRGYSIAVFPEGTRSRNGRIGRFHQGAFYIARQLNLDILPVMLYGTGNVLPPKTYHLCKGVISLSIGAPVNSEELSRMGSVRRQASEMHLWYVKNYTDLKNKIERDV